MNGREGNNGMEQKNGVMAAGTKTQEKESIFMALAVIISGFMVYILTQNVAGVRYNGMEASQASTSTAQHENRTEHSNNVHWVT